VSDQDIFASLFSQHTNNLSRIVKVNITNILIITIINISRKFSTLVLWISLKRNKQYFRRVWVIHMSIH